MRHSSRRTATTTTTRTTHHPASFPSWKALFWLWVLLGLFLNAAAAAGADFSSKHRSYRRIDEASAANSTKDTNSTTSPAEKDATPAASAGNETDSGDPPKDPAEEDEVAPKSVVPPANESGPPAEVSTNETDSEPVGVDEASAKKQKGGQAEKPAMKKSAAAAEEPTAAPVEPDAAAAKEPTAAPVAEPDAADPTEAPVAAEPDGAETKKDPTAAAPVTPPGDHSNAKDPTAAPVAEPDADPTDAPVAEPDGAETEDPTAAPVTPPTLAPVESESDNNESPTDEPVKEPTDPPVEPAANNADDSGSAVTDPCKGATTCLECTEKADLVSDAESTCWWTDGACEKVSNQEHEFEPPCPIDDNKADDWGDDNESMVPLLLGLVGVLIVVVVLFRKLCASRILVDDHASEHGKYQGLSTAEKDDDEEWGWDDEQPQARRNRQVEMVQTTPRSSGTRSAYHRRSRSPSSMSSPNSSGSNSGSAQSAPAKTRGLTVKRTGGLKNPLHAKHQPAPPHQPPRPAVAAAAPPLVKKQPANADDFFEDFGFSSKPPTATTKGKFGSPAAAAAPKPVSGLGATRLTVVDAGSNNDDWGDDDLDDLLDD